ncbi:MAG: glycogen/starch/alpha-glucan phosphorylase, partial [Erysipelothrix sp.]|nr:glycogen/starch/alpha-glucan phosphorylase [Erysipelothrix sp.]
MVENDTQIFKQELVETINKISKMSLSEVKASDVYRAIGVILQDHIGEDWTNTHVKQQDKDVKRMYYISMEFLTGKFTEKNLQYLDLYRVTKEAVEELGFSFEEVLAVENEPGLGNGGLGRLAAAFLDSLASLRLPGHGYGLRYEKGLFKQSIEDGRQVESPDSWLSEIDIWQYKREDAIYEVKLGGTIETANNNGKLEFKHVDYDSIKAEAYDIPILGYRNGVINNLRLWKSSSYEDINLEEFSKGNLRGAYESINRADSITQFLYPDDTNYEGKKLRLEQEYFLVSASVQDIMRKFKKKGLSFDEMSDHIAIHTNDTHPA